jgi:TolB-like protein
VGKDMNVVILPFADYSNANNLESAFRRNLFVNESIIDHFVRLGFHLPVQEDVFHYLAQQNIINVIAYNPQKTKSLEYEMGKEWSSAMKETLQGYIDYAQEAGVKSDEGDDALTHGLNAQEIVKIGRHFSADYIVRGRVLQYKDRLDPSGAIWKKGVLPFFVGGSKNVLLGKAMPQSYDSLDSLDSDWQSMISFGDAPQAVVQLRIWVQDAYTGNVIWTNRVNVEVAPKSFFADYQYDNLFETATEKAVASLMDDFAYTVYNVPLPVTKTERAKQ